MPLVCAKWRQGSGAIAPRPAEHGAHFYPWSKGGSSSLQNFVAACAAGSCWFLKEMLGRVLAAVAAPGMFLAVLMIIAAVVQGSDVRRRDPVRRFTRQQRREAWPGHQARRHRMLLRITRLLPPP